jgi:hypothetical protein
MRTNIGVLGAPRAVGPLRRGTARRGRRRSRNRGGGYGEAAARASPAATQVADRWRLMENANSAFLDAVCKSMRAIRGAIGATTIDPQRLTSAKKS